MYSLNKKILELKELWLKLESTFNDADLLAEAAEIRAKMLDSDFWLDSSKASKLSRRLEFLEKKLSSRKLFNNFFKNLDELMVLAGQDKKFYKELEKDLKRIELELKEEEAEELFSGKYDNSSAILSIKAGSGGVDAQDWAEILERMYLRFAERKNWKLKLLDRHIASEAGIKSATWHLSGERVYAYLKSENGVHRLLRNSPFNADSLRQTSFASVELIPEIGAEEIELRAQDIRIDVYRASGPGGQGVNKTDSAVRITHLESGLVVSCQSERSQHQNKENALKVLRSKLYAIAEQETLAKEQELKGEIRAEWGQQIRSYWFYGRQLVKDHRTNWQETNLQAVLDGQIEGFIFAFLKRLKRVGG